MLDLKKIRKDPELFDQLLEKRGIKPQVEKILKVDTKHRKILTELQEIQEKRNEASKKIGILKSKGGDTKLNSSRNNNSTHNISYISLSTTPKNHIA